MTRAYTSAGNPTDIKLTPVISFIVCFCEVMFVVRKRGPSLNICILDCMVRLKRDPLILSFCVFWSSKKKLKKKMRPYFSFWQLHRSWLRKFHCYWPQCATGKPLSISFMSHSSAHSKSGILWGSRRELQEEGIEGSETGGDLSRHFHLGVT